MRLRQVALVARDLDAVVADLTAVLGLGAAFHDPGVAMFGLRNAVMPVGDTFLEVVSPVQEGTTAGRFLDRRGGDGGYMVIVQREDLAADRRRLDALGVRVVFEVSLEDVATMHLHPRDVGGAILSLDWANPPASWRWAGPDWPRAVRTDVSRAIVGVEIEAREPAVVAARWSQVLDRPADARDDRAHAIELDAEGALRFVADADGRGDGVAAIDVHMTDRRRALTAARARALPVGDGGVVIGGVRFRFC